MVVLCCYLYKLLEFSVLGEPVFIDLYGFQVSTTEYSISSLHVIAVLSRKLSTEQYHNFPAVLLEKK